MLQKFRRSSRRCNQTCVQNAQLYLTFHEAGEWRRGARSPWVRFRRQKSVTPEDVRALLDALAQAILAAGAEAVVMGLPLLADGGESLTTRQVRNVTRRLQRRIPLPFYFMSEELSSEEAWDDLRAAGLDARRRRTVLDQQAAVRILESFLALAPQQRRPA